MTVAAPFFGELAEAPEGAAASWVTTADGQQIRAVVWHGGLRGTAVLFSGRSEYVEKYGRVIGRLVERGFSVLAFDWRGQGLSTRSHLEPRHGHVDDFRHYQRDWDAVLAHAEDVGLPRPFVLFGHSMGGCIGLHSLGEGSAFAGAVFSAPMWRLHMGMATRRLASGLARAANRLGLAGRRMPGTNRLPSALGLAFQNNTLTSCDEHFAWFGRQLTAEPALGLAGPSVQWTRAALEEMVRLSAAPLPPVPVMSFLGSEETVVSPAVIRKLTAKMPQGKLVYLEGARHEIFMERPVIQERVWAEIDAFLPHVAGAGAGRAPEQPGGFGPERTAANCG